MHIPLDITVVGLSSKISETDSVKKVYFGISPSYWLSNLIFLDTLRYYGYATRMSSYSLERYIQVDIDDVFLAKTELKMLERDVNRIVESQNLLQEVIPGFKYNLGYCGAFFQTGTEQTKRADQMLVDLEGLQPNYNNDEGLALEIRYLPALAFVAPLDVRECFEAAIEHLPTTISQALFYVYFEHTYIRRTLPCDFMKNHCFLSRCGNNIMKCFRDSKDQ